ncbi:MAG: agmatinase family protein [Bacteroidetes bacterium]|nr:agmatinase family protein [Bacteroidota bacterium]
MNLKKIVPIKHFDPNGTGVKGSIFGLPYTQDEASLILLPIPWEVTASYQGGAARGPEVVLEYSPQIDLLSADINEAWKFGIHMQEIDKDLIRENDRLRPLALRYMDWIEAGTPSTGLDHKSILNDINQACVSLKNRVKDSSDELLDAGKMVATLGGDHSTCLGLIESLASHYNQFAILQIDAHADLRENYQDFEISHASVMRHVLKQNQVEKLVQVGVRDLCPEEWALINQSGDHIVTFLDQNIKEELYEGGNWEQICERIIRVLPDLVYVSFDIDGLDARYCPHTGTPVPGGLEFDQVSYLLKKLVLSGKKIIGFDLSEVSGRGKEQEDFWDGNVGARMLYRLAGLMAVSQGKLEFIHT